MNPSEESTPAPTLLAFWSLVISFAALAAGLEGLRVDPTFGIGVSVWLFFPLLVVVWRGLLAGLLTVGLAVGIVLLTGQALFLPFDAAIAVFTIAVVGSICARARAPRIIDGILVAWVFTVPATVVFHWQLFQSDFNGGLLILVTFLLSQLVPGMLVQWLAWLNRPLLALEGLFGPRQSQSSVEFLVVFRAALVPMILLPLLVIQYFSLTQWLYAQQELDARQTIFLGENLILRMEQASNRAPDSPPQLGLSSLPASGDVSTAEGSVDLDGVDHWSYRFEPLTGEAAQQALDQPIVRVKPDLSPRSPIDWIFHREVVFVLPTQLQPTGTSGAPLGLHIDIDPQPVSLDDFKIWGVLAALLFLLALETIYRIFLVRLVAAVERLGERIQAWEPGQPLRVMNPAVRGWITQADQYATGIGQLVDGFNASYRAIIESNAERMRLFARVSGILTSISEPLIVTDEKLKLLPGFSNGPGKLWGRHLAASLATARSVLESDGAAEQPAENHEDGFVDAIVSVLQGDGSVLNRNLTLKDSDGNNHEFRLSVGVVPKGTEPPGSDPEMKAIGGFVFLLTDISLLLNRQWELGRRTRLASLENVAVGVAHELNQPLNTIRMVTHNLIRLAQKDGLDSFMIAAKLTRIDEQVDRMAGLISTMRAFSSGDTSNRRPLDPCALLRNVLTLQRGNLRTEHIDLRFADEELDCQVVANNNALGHVFAEIIENAMEALSTSGNEQRWLSVTTAIEGDNWQARFSDNGGGIPEDGLDRVFEPFFTTKEHAEHAGFGLHEAYRIMADLGGSLTASNTDHGACFVVQVPLATGDDVSS